MVLRLGREELVVVPRRDVGRGRRGGGVLILWGRVQAGWRGLRGVGLSEHEGKELAIAQPRGWRRGWIPRRGGGRRGDERREGAARWPRRRAAKVRGLVGGSEVDLTILSPPPYYEQDKQEY